MTATEMTSRAADLARRLEQSSDELARAVAGCSEEQWAATCPEEGRTVGVMVHHIASSIPLVTAWAEQVANEGTLPPVTMDLVHAGNAEHAAAHTGCERGATLDMLRRNTAAAAAQIRALSDEQLERSAPFALFGGQPTSAAAVLEMILIGHVHGFPHSHLPNIKAALEA